MAGAYMAPTTFRTARSIAIAKGTTPSGFEGQVDFEPRTGLPTTVPSAKSEYNDVANAAMSPPSAAVRGTVATDPTPFRLGGSK